MVYSSKQKKYGHKRIIMLVAVCLLAAAAIAFVAYRHWPGGPSPQPTTTQSPSTDNDYVNMQPAAPAEQADSDEHKQASLPNSDTSPTPAPSTQGVTPIIVDASQYDAQVEVRAFVPGIVEDGGTCTIAFTGPAGKVTKQVSANADATTTRCQNLTLKSTDLRPTGTWRVSVAYKSANAQGESQESNLTIK